MGLWQSLGHQSGHCFNDHRLFSSLASPSTPISSLYALLIPEHSLHTLLIVDGRSFIGSSEFQKPNYQKLHVQGNGNGCHLFYSKSFLVWSFDASTGNLMFLFPGMRHSTTAVQDRE